MRCAGSVAVDVDEAGADPQARRIDLDRRLLRGQVSDRGNAVTANADVGPVPRPATAVDDRAVAQVHVERCRTLRRRCLARRSRQATRRR